MVTLILNSSPASISIKQRYIIKAAINIPRRVGRIQIPGLRTGGAFPEQMEKPMQINTAVVVKNENSDPTVVAKLYAIMEAVADRVEMHRNVGQHCDNWNSLLLTSINSMTLAAGCSSSFKIRSRPLFHWGIRRLRM